MCQEKTKKSKDSVALRRPPLREHHATRAGQKQLCLGGTPPRSPRPAQAAPESTARSAEAPGFESRRRRRRPGPQRPPARPPAPRPAGPPTLGLPAPSSPRRSAGLHSRGRTHGGGVALRGPRAARSRSRPRFRAPPGLGRHGLRPASAPWPAPAAAPPAPGCPRPDPAFIWLAAPFSWGPTGKPKQLEPRRRGKENGKAGRAEAARGDAGVGAGASRATAGRPGRVRGAGSPSPSRPPPIVVPPPTPIPLPLPAARAQAWPGTNVSGSSLQRHQEFGAVAVVLP